MTGATAREVISWVINNQMVVIENESLGKRGEREKTKGEVKEEAGQR